MAACVQSSNICQAGIGWQIGWPWMHHLCVLTCGFGRGRVGLSATDMPLCQLTDQPLRQLVRLTNPSKETVCRVAMQEIIIAAKLHVLPLVEVNLSGIQQRDEHSEVPNQTMSYGLYGKLWLQHCCCA